MVRHLQDPRIVVAETMERVQCKCNTTSAGLTTVHDAAKSLGLHNKQIASVVGPSRELHGTLLNT